MKRCTPLLIGSVALLAAHVAAAGDLEFVRVGDAGNPADFRYEPNGRGSVAYEFDIAKFEITTTQYVEFLNAIARTDTNGVYRPDMGNPLEGGCGILRSGPAGNRSYSVHEGRESVPVNHVNIRHAARFANWLHNGKPGGLQGPGTTENGAYDLAATGTGAPIRLPGAQYFIPNEDEWYKAAYYKGTGPESDYWDYPTRSDVLPTAAPPPGGFNTANYMFAAGFLSDVGAYTQSAGPYGTFDQGGNVWEWTETVSDDDDLIIRGGGWYGSSSDGLRATDSIVVEDGETELDLGIRIARVPEPASALIALGGALLALRRSTRG